MDSQEKLLEALSVVALHELCSYIDLEGNPVMCDYEAYLKQYEFEFNKYKLTKEQFDIICGYITKTYQGKL